MKILIVDDAAPIVRLFQHILEKGGHTVESAENGVEGLRQFEAGSPNLVIADLRMPEMGGEDMASLIRGKEPTVPIIVHCGRPTEIRRPELFSAVLEKPCTPQELLDCVAAVFAKGNSLQGAGR